MPINHRQWSAERRAPPGCADCASWSARGREAQRSAPAGLRHWPAKGASQAPECLSALRSLTLVREKQQASERKCLARTKTHVRDQGGGDDPMFARGSHSRQRCVCPLPQSQNS
jgi:hypothetical protein